MLLLAHSNRWLAVCLGLAALGCSGEEEEASTPPVEKSLECETCDDGNFCNGEEKCVEGVCQPGEPVDCDDGIECSIDSCDKRADSCKHEGPDVDHDDHADATCKGMDGKPLGDDCDDNDGDRFPGNQEICRPDMPESMLHDEDCDSATYGFLDEDGDGSSSLECCNTAENGTQICGGDCDDSDNAVFSEQPEFCDKKDNNCNGETDEIENSIPWYVDADEDGFGAPGEFLLSCSPISGYSHLGTDCDDTRSQVNPGNVEVCDEKDNTCDDYVDEFLLSCKTGTQPDEKPVNECHDEEACGEFQTCVDKPLGYNCLCPSGYFMGQAGCEDVVECGIEGLITCPEKATCVEAVGKASTCACEKFYQLNGNGTVCVDLNECAVENGGCGDSKFFTCQDLPGKAPLCAAIDLCAGANAQCDPLVTCTNRSGALPSCGSCPAGYTGEGDASCTPTLTGLTVSQGTLSPAFASSVLAYSIEVPLSVTELSLTPEMPAGVSAEISWKKLQRGPLSRGEVASDEATEMISLEAGTQSIVVKLLQQGQPSRSYEVSVTRGKLLSYIKAGVTDSSDHFGYSVGISGGWMAVGAPDEASGDPEDPSDDSAPGAGAVYIFQRVGGSWVQQAYLKAGNLGAGDEFGSAIALQGNTLVVGAPGEDGSAATINGADDDSAVDAGAAYVFVRSGSAWTQQAYVKPIENKIGYGFGRTVATTGGRATVGAKEAAFAFVRSSGDWSQQAYLQPQGIASGYGASVSMTGTRLVVGSGGNQDVGVEVYLRSGEIWSFEQALVAPSSAGQDRFGAAVSIFGLTIAVGAPDEDSIADGINGDTSNNGATNAGAAYVYVFDGESWQYQAYIKAPNSGYAGNFGSSLQFRDETLLVGAIGERAGLAGLGGDQPGTALLGSGGFYTYARTGGLTGTWGGISFVKADFPGANEYFGASVAMDNGTIVVGAVNESSNATGINGDPDNDALGASGAVFVYE